MDLSPDQMERFEAYRANVTRSSKHLARILDCDPDESLSACLIALAYACKTFDPTRRINFLTYLWPSCYRAVKRAAQYDRLIHIPHNFFDGTMRRDLEERAGRVLGAAPFYYQDWEDEALIDPSSVDPQEEAIAAEERAALIERAEALLSPLTSRQRIILKARARNIRQETIGAGLGISGSRVQQIETEAWARVRQHIRRLGERS